MDDATRAELFRKLFGDEPKELLENEGDEVYVGDPRAQHALPYVPDPPATANVATHSGRARRAAAVTGSGRARRAAATRAMQGWNAPHRYGNDEIEPVVENKRLKNKDKCKRKSIGSVKSKRTMEVEHPAREETSEKPVTSVVDIGPRCDWMKINVIQNADYFEVYALVPGFSCEEVKVNADPIGRLVIMGQPEDDDNPWGITAFQKVVILPTRIDTLHMAALVTPHGQLFVRIPIEQS